MSIGANETVYRMVNPTMWIAEENRLSSALFKDKKGASVDRDIDREEEQVIADFEQRGKIIKGIVSVTIEQCQEVPVVVQENVLPENKYHALIIDSPEKIQLSKSKLKKLIDVCRIVKEY